MLLPGLEEPKIKTCLNLVLSLTNKQINSDKQSTGKEFTERWKKVGKIGKLKGRLKSFILSKTVWKVLEFIDHE